MKRETIAKWILLEQSGELHLLGRWILHWYLQRDPSMQDYRNDLMLITKSYREYTASQLISDQAMDNIMAAAKEAASLSEEYRLEPLAPPVFSWKPALVYASALLLLLAGVVIVKYTKSSGTTQVAQLKTYTTPSNQNLVSEKDSATVETLAWDDHMDEAISDLGSMVAMASEDWEDYGKYSETTESIDDIATELLELEGSNI